MIDGWSRPESLCLDVECSSRNIEHHSEDNITLKLSVQHISTMNDSGGKKVEVEEKGLELSKYYFSKLNNLLY